MSHPVTRAITMKMHDRYLYIESLKKDLEIARQNVDRDVARWKRAVAAYRATVESTD